MASPTRTPWTIRALTSAIALLALLAMWITVRAAWVLTHGGNSQFDGLFNYPRWMAVHFVAAFVFTVILPFQLWPQLRNACPDLHRIAGRIAAACGILFAVTGIVLPFAMPARPFGERFFMTTFGSLFCLLLWRGVAAARHGHFMVHRHFMLRVAAAALSPLTQRVVFPLFAAAGIDSLVRFWDLFVTALWFSTFINLVVVEWWIRRTSLAAAWPASPSVEMVASRALGRGPRRRRVLPGAPTFAHLGKE